MQFSSHYILQLNIFIFVSFNNPRDSSIFCPLLCFRQFHFSTFFVCVASFFSLLKSYRFCCFCLFLSPIVSVSVCASSEAKAFIELRLRVSIMLMLSNRVDYRGRIKDYMVNKMSSLSISIER